MGAAAEDPVSTADDFGSIEVIAAIPLPPGDPVEVDVIWPAGDHAPCVIGAVPEWRMSAETARQLAAALLDAADRIYGHPA